MVFDVETTGLSAIYNDLIQVAARCEGNIIAEFDEFINPGHPLSAFAELTGITDDHVKNAKQGSWNLKILQGIRC